MVWSGSMALTKAGRHTLHANLACCGGLQAAFSESPSTGSGNCPAAYQGDWEPDWPALNGLPLIHRRVTPSQPLQWEGLLLNFGETHYTLIGATSNLKAKVWVGSNVLLDSCKNPSQTLDECETRVVGLLTINSSLPQRLRLVVYQSSAAMALNLTWRQRDFDEPEAVPPSSICWLDKDIRQSPIHLTVRPSLIEASSVQALLPDGDSNLVAGRSRNIILSVQDVHGNWVSSRDIHRLAIISLNNLAGSSNADLESTSAGVVSIKQGEEDALPGSQGVNVTVLLTCAGDYTLNVNRQAAMDLMATYYSDSELTIPWRVKPLAHIDFSRAVTDPCLDAARSVCAEDGEFLSGLPSGLAYNEPYSIRWLGFISPGVADNLTVYTLNLSLAGDDERVKLWIDNSLIVQQWTSRTFSQMVATMVLPSNDLQSTYYQLRIEYKQLSASSGVSLTWTGGSLGYARFETALALRMTVVAGSIDVIRSRISGSGLTLATACGLAHFTILARDAFDNAVPIDQQRDQWDLDVMSAKFAGRSVPRVLKTSCRVSCSAKAHACSVDYRATASGRYVLVAKQGSVHLSGSPSEVVVLPGVAKSVLAQGSALTIGTAGADLDFTIRARDCAKTSVSIPPGSVQDYQFKMHYNTAVSAEGNLVVTRNPHGFATATVQCTVSGTYSFRIFRLPSGELKGSPYTLKCLPAEPAGIFSTIMGASITIATAGMEEQFGIVLRDRFGNECRESLKGECASQILFYNTTDTSGGYTKANVNRASVYTGSCNVVWMKTRSGHYHINVGYVSVHQSFVPIMNYLVAVWSGAISSVTSSALGSSLTIMTVGQHSSFTLIGKDSYGNGLAISHNLRLQVSIDTVDVPVLSAKPVDGEGKWNVTVASITRAGTYNIEVGLFESHGLSATYYGDPFFSTASVVQVDSYIDFSWGFSRPVSQVVKDYFSVRWSGYISSRYSELHLLYLFGVVDPDLFRAAPDCAKYIVGERARDVSTGALISQPRANQSSLDLCAKGGKREIGMWERAFHMDERYMYSLTVEYRAAAGAAGCKLRWSGLKQMPDSVTPQFLHRLSRFQRLPSQVHVIARTGDNRGRCRPAGDGLTVLTAGRLSSFTVTCIDEYGNALSNRDDMLVHARLNSSSSSTFLPQIHAATNSTHVFNMVLTVAQQHRLDVFNFRRGYLSATYYDGGVFHPAYARKSIMAAALPGLMIAGDVLLQGIPGGSEWSLPQPFGVRWAGFLDFRNLSEASTLFVSLQTPDDRVKLWIDNMLLVQQWASLDTCNISASLGFRMQPVREFRVQYLASSNASGRMNLTWTSSSRAQPRPVDPEAFLAGESATAQSSDLFQTESLSGTLCFVQPGTVCVANSLLFGSGLTVGRVGTTSTFTVVQRDEYGNPSKYSLIGDDIHVVQFLVQSSNPRLLLSCASNSSHGVFNVSYDVGHSLAKNYANVNYVQLESGLSATFYNATGHEPLWVGTGKGKSFSTDFSSTAHSVAPGSPNLTRNSPYTVRWAGFVYTPFQQTYTLRPELAEADERVKVWIDNRVIIDQWASLLSLEPQGTIRFPNAGFYDIVLVYKQLENASGFTLKGKGILGIENGLELDNPIVQSRVLTQQSATHLHLFHGLRVSDKSISLSIGHGVGNASHTRATGAGLTLNTAGVMSSFIITVRDAGGAHVETNSSLSKQVLGLLHWAGPFSGNGYVAKHQEHRIRSTWQENLQANTRSFTFLPTLSGQYIGSISMYSRGGLTATYWDNLQYQFLNDESVRVYIDPVLSFQWNTSNPFFRDGDTSVNAYSSVKWTGYILPRFSESYTIIVTLDAKLVRRDGRLCKFCHDRVQVFINGVTQIVTDSALSDPITVSKAAVREHSSIVFFEMGVLQHLHVEGRHFEGNAIFKLEWMSPSTPRQIIPSERLYHFTEILQTAPLRMLVVSGARNASASTVIPFASIMTSGKLSADKHGKFEVSD